MYSLGLLQYCNPNPSWPRHAPANQCLWWFEAQQPSAKHSNHIALHHGYMPPIQLCHPLGYMTLLVLAAIVANVSCCPGIISPSTMDIQPCYGPLIYTKINHRTLRYIKATTNDMVITISTLAFASWCIHPPRSKNFPPQWKKHCSY